MLVVGMILALAVGIYVGVGMPGLPGPENEVLPPGSRRRRRAKHQFLHWLRPQKTDRHRRR